MSNKILFGRTSKILSLATKVASKELGLKIKESIQKVSENDSARALVRTQQAKIITKNLSQLKGAAMKAGQLMSIDSSQYLPPEAREILSQLQNMAEPESFDKIALVLKSELKQNLKSITELNEIPFAAASIGQVHKAQYKQTTIAIKVQYPGVENSIHSDLKILKNLVNLLMIPTKKKINFDATFNELANVLNLEADYIHEAEVLQFVHNKLINDKFFYAPKVYTEISTKKVLSMEYCEGITLNDWINSKPSMSDRKFFAQKMLDLFMIEFLDWNIVQTDPNFGNYLVQNNPLNVVLLDFGSTQKFTNEFIGEYLRTIHLTSLGDYDQLIHQAINFELILSKESNEAKRAFFEMMTVSMEPFLSNQQPFDFTSNEYENRSRETVLNFTRLLKYSAPPRKILFLHRKLGGLFNLLKRLEVQIDLQPYWNTLMRDEV